VTGRKGRLIAGERNLEKSSFILISQKGITTVKDAEEITNTNLVNFSICRNNPEIRGSFSR